MVTLEVKRHFSIGLAVWRGGVHWSWWEPEEFKEQEEQDDPMSYLENIKSLNKLIKKT